jgi:hypothetical protein
VQLIEFRLGCSDGEEVTQAATGEQIWTRNVDEEARQAVVLDARPQKCPRVFRLGDDPLDSLASTRSLVLLTESAPDVGRQKPTGNQLRCTLTLFSTEG